MPDAILYDGSARPKAAGLRGQSMMASGRRGPDRQVRPRRRCRVFAENDRDVEPGSGDRGLVAIGRPHPSATTRTTRRPRARSASIDGVRYVIPGDWATVEADGTLTLLGRGCACINTAGEKVFPEEVEEALKSHPAVEDCPGGRPARREVGPGGDRRRAPERRPEPRRGRPARPRAQAPGRLQDAEADRGDDRVDPRRQRQGRLPVGETTAAASLEPNL